jgi:hypothetical protein
MSENKIKRKTLTISQSKGINTSNNGSVMKKSQTKQTQSQEKLNSKIKSNPLTEIQFKVNVVKGKPSILAELICAKDNSNALYQNYRKYIAKVNEEKLSIQKSRDFKSEIIPFRFDKESPDDKALKSRNRKTANIDDLFKKLVV